MHVADILVIAVCHCIAASLIFIVYATVTLNGARILNFPRYNYPWSENTIGVFDNLLLLGFGLLWSAFSRTRSGQPSTAHPGAGLPIASTTPYSIRLGETL